MKNITDPQKNQLYWWLSVAIFALACSGVFSIFIVLLRTPQLQNLLSGHNFFKPSLIIHVNLSVLVWLTATQNFWNISMIKNNNYLLKLLPIMSLIGCVLMSLSILFEGNAILNNYIPIYHNNVFLCGLVLYLTAFSAQNLISFINVKLNDYTRFVSFTIAIINLTAMTILLITSKQLYRVNIDFTLHQNYEYLFWGMGHILQFSFVQNMMIIVSFLLKNKGININFKLEKFYLLINSLLAFIMVFWQINDPFMDTDYINIYTEHMKYVGGIIPGIWIITTLFYLIKNKIWINSLALGIIMFAYGGILGHLISGVNVVIPAHYHGSIVGISIVTMGFIYKLVAQLNKVEISNWANKQLILYFFGQILHITALAYSGGYGALRKSPEGYLSIQAKISMGIMGFGGLLAICGGLIFIILIIKMLIMNNRKQNLSYAS